MRVGTRTRGLFTLVTFLLAAGAQALGVGGQTSAAAGLGAQPVAAQEEWTRYERAGDGFAISLPPGWKDIQVDRATLEASVAALREKNPELGAILRSYLDDPEVLAANKLQAFDFSFVTQDQSPGFVTNVNVITEALDVDVSPSVYAQVTAAQIEQLPNIVKPMQRRSVALPSGPGEELHYRMTMTSPAGHPSTLAATQYVVIRQKVAYVVTFTTTADQAESYAPTFEEIARRFELLDPA